MKFLYTGAFRFPNQDAAAKRVLNVSKALPKNSDVEFAGWEENYKGNSVYTYQGYKCFSQAELLSQSNIFLRLLSFLFKGWKTFKWLQKRERYDGVVLYNPPFIFALTMLMYCKVKNIKLILDSTEWYESEHLIGGRYGIAAIENYLRMKCAYPLFANVIVISEFLAEYFKDKGVKNIVRVLPLSESFEGELAPNIPVIKLVYIGNLGKKDKLDSIFNFVIKHKENIELDIAGVNEKDFFDIYPHLLNHKGNYNNVIRFHGRIDSDRVKKLYLQASFSVFFREKKRYALAGFPTKFIESVCFSVPVITNPIGDIVNFSNGVAILLKPEDLEKNLIKEMNKLLTEKKLSNFQSIYEQSFSINSAKSALSLFISKVFK
jgi:glycosyltransferase involved in cell wall biosynthesis